MTWLTGQEFCVEESFLIFGDTAHHAGVYDALQSHAERIDITPGLGRVKRGQLLQLTVNREHCFTGVLNWGDFFYVTVDYLEPA